MKYKKSLAKSMSKTNYRLLSSLLSNLTKLSVLTDKEYNKSISNLNRLTGFNTHTKPSKSTIALNEIVVQFFGDDIEKSNSTFENSYDNLVSLMYDLSKIGVIDTNSINGIVDQLDEIFNE